MPNLIMKFAFDKLYDYVDYFVVNVSSPNTPGLRALQDKEPLMKILSSLVNKRKLQSAHKPILLKIAPDLTNSQLDDVVDIVKESGIEGIVATNTTISRENLLTDKAAVEAIGAGRPQRTNTAHSLNRSISIYQQKKWWHYSINRSRRNSFGRNSKCKIKCRCNFGAALYRLYL
jgi:hypothetical protein